jgi:hypothetical protein
VTNRFNAMMTLFKWRQQARYGEWATERLARERSMRIAVTGAPFWSHIEIE